MSTKGVLQLAQPHEAQCYIDLARLLVTGTNHFYNNPTFSDITLVCPDGRQLKCHQIILAASSKRLASVLKQGDFAGQKLPVQGVDSDALDTLIHSFYTGECPLALSSAASIYDAAVKLEVNGLPGAVEQFVSSSLQPGNACSLLERCLSAKALRLAELCLEFIRSRLSEVVSTVEFRSSSLEVVAHICADIANARQLPQYGLQVAIAWLTSPGTGGASRLHLAGPLAEAMGINPEVLKSVLHSNTASLLPDTPPLDLLGLAGSSRDGPSVGAGTGNSGGQGGGSLPLLQLLPGGMGQLQGLGGVGSLQLSGGSGSGAASQLLLGQTGGGPGLFRGNNNNNDSDVGNGPAALNMNSLRGFNLGNLALAQLGRELGSEDGSGALPPGLLAGNAGGGGGGGGGNGNQGGDGQGVGGNTTLAAALAAAAAAAAGNNSGQRNKRPRVEAKREGLDAAGDGPGNGGGGGGSLSNTPGGGGVLQQSPFPEGSRERRAPQLKGVCHVEGCYADLTGLRDYHLRYKICDYHLKVSSVIKDGVPQRFCQQCGRFHNLHEFDGHRRSCRTMLARHNQRRAKKMGQPTGNNSPGPEDAPGGGVAGGAQLAQAGHMQAHHAPGARSGGGDALGGVEHGAGSGGDASHDGGPVMGARDGARSSSGGSRGGNGAADGPDGMDSDGPDGSSGPERSGKGEGLAADAGGGAGGGDGGDSANGGHATTSAGGGNGGARQW